MEDKNIYTLLTVNEFDQDINQDITVQLLDSKMNTVADNEFDAFALMFTINNIDAIQDINITKIKYPHQSIIYNDECEMIGKMFGVNNTVIVDENLKEEELWNLNLKQ